MDIAVLDACPGFKEDVLHATQDRNESVEVVQGVDQQRNPNTVRQVITTD